MQFIQCIFGLKRGQYLSIQQANRYFDVFTVLLILSQVFLSLYTDELVNAAQTCITPL